MSFEILVDFFKGQVRFQISGLFRALGLKTILFWKPNFVLKKVQRVYCFIKFEKLHFLDGILNFQNIIHTRTLKKHLNMRFSTSYLG